MLKFIESFSIKEQTNLAILAAQFEALCCDAAACHHQADKVPGTDPGKTGFAIKCDDGIFVADSFRRQKEAVLLIGGISFYAVARMSPALFVGQRVILRGTAAWLVPPIVTLGLLVLRETGNLTTRYTTQSTDFASQFS